MKPLAFTFGLTGLLLGWAGWYVLACAFLVAGILFAVWWLVGEDKP